MWGGSASAQCMLGSPLPRDPPHPRGKLRGIRSRPRSKGEIERDQIQAHTQGGNSGGSGPDPPPEDYCCGRYASYWNAFLLISLISFFWNKGYGFENSDFNGALSYMLHFSAAGLYRPNEQKSDSEQEKQLLLWRVLHM